MRAAVALTVARATHDDAERLAVAMMTTRMRVSAAPTTHRCARCDAGRSEVRAIDVHADGWIDEDESQPHSIVRSDLARGGVRGNAMTVVRRWWDA